MWNYVHMDVRLDWIPELVCQITTFLANGTAMPTSHLQTEAGEDICYTGCELGGCSFDCAVDSFIQCP